MTPALLRRIIIGTNESKEVGFVDNFPVDVLGLEQ